MELSKQVVSLELSKRLKELGVKQESLWYWVMYSSEEGGNGSYFLIDFITFQENKYRYIFPYSAFTVAELGEMLPMDIHSKGKSFIFTAIRMTKNNWLITYTHDGGRKTLAIVLEKGEANARAKMLIYLIENKLIKL